MWIRKGVTHDNHTRGTVPMLRVSVSRPSDTGPASGPKGPVGLRFRVVKGHDRGESFGGRYADTTPHPTAYTRILCTDTETPTAALSCGGRPPSDPEDRVEIRPTVLGREQFRQSRRSRPEVHTRTRILYAFRCRVGHVRPGVSEDTLPSGMDETLTASRVLPSGGGIRVESVCPIGECDVCHPRVIPQKPII